MCVVGTRPEAIKFLSIIRTLRADPRFTPILCATSQHRHMMDQVLAAFGLKPDIDLDIMRASQDPIDVTCRVLEGMKEVLQTVRPDWVLVQGDTVTAFAAALAAYYARTAVGHVEAGLRTGCKYAPFPEELMRSGITVFGDAHFAPTARARENLLKENVPAERIWVTGNTGIDAVKLAGTKIDAEPHLKQEMDRRFRFLDESRRLILVTAHRRESFGAGFEQICLALQDLASREDVQIVYPVHLNPNVRETVTRILGPVLSPATEIGKNEMRPGAGFKPRIALIEPEDYLSFTYLLHRAYLVLTDSGGIQEEAPSLGRPVLVMREVTERPEAIEAGSVQLVGTSRSRIVAAATRLLDNPGEYARMARPVTVYGDGRAAERIAAALVSIGNPQERRM